MTILHIQIFQRIFFVIVKSKTQMEEYIQTKIHQELKVAREFNDLEDQCRHMTRNMSDVIRCDNFKACVNANPGYFKYKQNQEILMENLFPNGYGPSSPRKSNGSDWFKLKRIQSHRK